MSKAKSSAAISYDSLFFSRTNDFLNKYLLRQAGKSECTRKAYKSVLGTFYDYVTVRCGIPATKFQFSQCSYAFFLDYSQYLQSERHLKNSTVNSHLAALRSYLEYASDCDASLISVYIVARRVPLLTVPKVQKPVIEPKDIKTFLNSPADTKAGRRDRFILILLFDTAIRVSELVSISLGDIMADGPRYSVLIHGKGRKERCIALSEKTAEHLKLYLRAYHDEGEDPSAPLIYTVSHGTRARMSVRNVQRILAKYGDMAREQSPSIPKSISPHTMRRTRATTMYRDGVPIEQVSAMLGHAEIETTRSHYASPSREQMREIVERGSANVPAQDAEWIGKEDEIKRKFGL